MGGFVVNLVVSGAITPGAVELLASQLTAGELRSLAADAGRTADACERQIEREVDRLHHSTMTPEQEQFWLGETRTARLARLRRHRAAANEVATDARAALRLLQ